MRRQALRFMTRNSNLPIGFDGRLQGDFAADQSDRFGCEDRYESKYRSPSPSPPFTISLRRSPRAEFVDVSNFARRLQHEIRRCRDVRHFVGTCARQRRHAVRQIPAGSDPDSRGMFRNLQRGQFLLRPRLRIVGILCRKMHRRGDVVQKPLHRPQVDSAPAPIAAAVVQGRRHQPGNRKIRRPQSGRVPLSRSVRSASTACQLQGTRRSHT